MVPARLLGPEQREPTALGDHELRLVPLLVGALETEELVIEALRAPEVRHRERHVV